MAIILGPSCCRLSFPGLLSLAQSFCDTLDRDPDFHQFSLATFLTCCEGENRGVNNRDIFESGAALLDSAVRRHWLELLVCSGGFSSTKF